MGKPSSRLELLRGTADLLILRRQRSGKGRRVHYRITPVGQKPLSGHNPQWRAFARAMALVLKPAGEERR